MRSVLMNEIDLFVVNRAERSVKRTRPYAAESDQTPTAPVSVDDLFERMLDKELKAREG